MTPSPMEIVELGHVEDIEHLVDHALHGLAVFLLLLMFGEGDGDGLLALPDGRADALSLLERHPAILGIRASSHPQEEDVDAGIRAV